MELMFLKFLEWAQLNNMPPTIDKFDLWKAGYMERQPEIDRLRSEVTRIHEIVTEKNHQLGIG